MKKLALSTLAALAVAACTTTEQRASGAGVGAVAGAAVAGPVGAVVGGVGGAVAGPAVSQEVGVPQQRQTRTTTRKRVQRS